MARRSLYLQILIPILSVMSVLVLITAWDALGWMRNFYMDETGASLEIRARLAERELKPALLAGNATRVNDLCKELDAAAHARITVVLPDGTVAGDSEESPAVMDNHGDRPEIREAFAGNTGHAKRYSHTLQTDSFYTAIPIYDGERLAGAIRASASLASIETVLHNVATHVALGSLAVAFAGAAIVLVIARRITQPLRNMELGARLFGKGELDRQLAVPNSAELATLAEAINHMAADLRVKIQAIEHRKHELDSVLSSMMEGVLAVDTGGGVIWLNKAAGQMLDTDMDTARGRDYLEIVRQARLQECIARILKEQDPFEDEILLAGANQVCLHVSAAPLHDGQGAKLGALLVLNDVTSLRKLEKARSEFVANVSHEIRTPVTSIKGYAETLLNDPPDDPETARRFLETLTRQADRLCTLVDDILSLSTLERSEVSGEAAFEQTPLRGVAESAIGVCTPKAKEKTIALILECAPDLTARVNAAYLEQAIVNLLDNALKYSPENSQVSISAAREQNEIRIRVRDNGAGIAAEHLSRIFERFYRVDRARSRTLGGTGLGLAIVKHIATLHGGAVTVESTLGKGSCFTLRLPAFQG